MHFFRNNGHHIEQTDYLHKEEMKDNRDSIDLGSSDVKKSFRAIFIPTLLGMIFNMSFILVDGILVGHGIGSHGLASINLVAPLMMLINGLGMMFGIGASVVAAIHLSHNNRKAARINTTQAFLAGTTCSIIMGLICYLFPSTIIDLLGAEGTLIHHVTGYYLWFIPTCLFMMIQAIGLFVIRLDGSPKYAMTANIIPAIINGLLDYIFIYPCDMGLKGAALATDIGSGIGALMVLYYMLFKCKNLNLYKLKHSRTSLYLTARNIGYMANVGLPGLIGELAVGVLMLVGNLQFIKYSGEEGIAAYSIACYLFPLIYMLCNAVAQSAQPIISYNHGANQPHQVSKTFQYSLRIGILSGLVVTVLFIAFPAQISCIFLDKSVPAYNLIVEGLPYFAFTFLFMAINICYIGYYQSIEKGRLAIVFTLLRGLVLLVATFVILPLFMGTTGLWLATPVAEFITTITIVIHSLLSQTKENIPDSTTNNQ